MPLIDELIADLARELKPMVPYFFGKPVIDIWAELNKNKEKIERWLKRNKNLINQL